MSFWRLYYHLVWATRGRTPIIVGERAELVERAIRAACDGKGAIVHAVGVMPDHVHVVASIPPRVAIAEVMQRVKGMSSHLLNERSSPSEAPFAWQAEYGVFSFAERSLPTVVAYVRNQPAHHAAGSTRIGFETYANAAPPPGAMRGGTPGTARGEATPGDRPRTVPDHETRESGPPIVGPGEARSEGVPGTGPPERPPGTSSRDVTLRPRVPRGGEAPD